MTAPPAPDTRYPADSVGGLIVAITGRLARTGAEAPRLDARVLVAHVLDRDQGWLAGHPEAAVDAARLDRLEALVRRREAREPVAYLTGGREFWSLEFEVTPATLIPRPDSETLIAEALKFCAARDAAPRILDLGTGSGCLLVTLLSELPAALGVGTDISDAALGVAADNAARHGVQGRAEFRRGDWLEDGALADAGRFDLVIANPPYIGASEIAGLAPDVAEFEPLGALAAGTDGLDAYRRIAPGLAGVLAPDGRFIGEFGVGQADRVAGILAAAGLRVIGVHADLGGRQRCVSAGIQGFAAGSKKGLE